MNTFPKKYVIDNLKKSYPAGCRVQLDSMDDPYCKVPEGTQGTVVCVDDIGTIHVDWDNGSSLGVVYGEDRCHKI